MTDSFSWIYNTSSSSSSHILVKRALATIISMSSQRLMKYGKFTTCLFVTRLNSVPRTKMTSTERWKFYLISFNLFHFQVNFSFLRWFSCHVSCVCQWKEFSVFLGLSMWERVSEFKRQKSNNTKFDTFSLQCLVMNAKACSGWG